MRGIAFTLEALIVGIALAVLITYMTVAVMEHIASMQDVPIGLENRGRDVIVIAGYYTVLYNTLSEDLVNRMAGFALEQLGYKNVYFNLSIIGLDTGSSETVSYGDPGIAMVGDRFIYTSVFFIDNIDLDKLKADTYAVIVNATGEVG